MQWRGFIWRREGPSSSSSSSSIAGKGWGVPVWCCVPLPPYLSYLVIPSSVGSSEGHGCAPPSYLREFGSASSVDELAAQIDRLRGIRLQLVLHSHLLSADTWRRERGGRLTIIHKTNMVLINSTRVFVCRGTNRGYEGEEREREREKTSC